MKKLLISILLIGLIAPVNFYAQNKVTIRGKLVEQSLKEKSPLSTVAVTILNTADSVRSVPVYTGSDGIYLIYDVIPGEYILEIWNEGLKSAPAKYKIKVVKNNSGFFDIAQIITTQLKLKKARKK